MLTPEKDFKRTDIHLSEISPVTLPAMIVLTHKPINLAKTLLFAVVISVIEGAILLLFNFWLVKQH